MRRNPRGPHREQWVHAQGCRRWFRCCAIPSATRSWVTRPSRRARPPPGPMPPGREVRNETGRPTGGRGASTVPSPCISRSTAWRTRATGRHAGLGAAGQWPAFRRPQLQVSPPARHRRGGVEANAVVQLEAGPYSVPNARATEIELYQGLAASSVNAEPSLERDRLAINQRLARFLPAGFYYKTFMWPRRLAPLRGQDPRGRRPGQRAGCPRCRALRQALRPLRCAGVGRRTGGIGGRRRGSRDRRARDPGGRTARAGRQPVVLPGRDRRRAGIALGRAHRGGPAAAA